MKLWEAIKFMEDGKKVTHTTFKYFNFNYLYMNKETEHITTSNDDTFDINGMDGVNDNWELYDDRKELPEKLKWVKDAYHFLNGDSCNSFDCPNCELYTIDICQDLNNELDKLNMDYKLD